MRIGVDIGGTFAGLVCVDDAGALHTAKTPPAPDDPSAGVMDGLALPADGMGRDGRAPDGHSCSVGPAPRTRVWRM